MRHSVLRSIRGTLSTVPQSSPVYIDMVRSGNYTEVYEGTRKACEDWAEEQAAATAQQED